MDPDLDGSHTNCGKDQTRMPTVFEEIIRQRSSGNAHVPGAMLESHLVAGSQSLPSPKSELTWGQSITDQCLDWETTAHLVRKAAEAL